MLSTPTLHTHTHTHTHTHSHTQNQPRPQQSSVTFVRQRPPNKFILSFLALCLCSWCWPALVFAILGIIYSIQVTTQCVSFPIHRVFSLSTNTSIYIRCRLSMRDNNGLSKFGKSSFLHHYDKHLHIHRWITSGPTRITTVPNSTQSELSAVVLRPSCWVAWDFFCFVSPF